MSLTKNAPLDQHVRLEPKQNCDDMHLRFNHRSMASGIRAGFKFDY